MNYFFVTGTYRSGTTLLEKIIGSHEKIFSAEQPFPTIFILLKKKFLEISGISQQMPLGHLFAQEQYTPETFTNFLEEYRIDKEILSESLEWAAKFDGVKTKEILKAKDYIITGSYFNEFYQSYIDALSVIKGKKQVITKGSKEIVTEEYIPYFLRHKTKTILIIRDIRDVINSANFGKGNQYIGEIRPTLYTIRIWRKSVAFALKYIEHPDFLVVKYENLIKNTEETLDKIFNFLNIQGFDINSIISQINSTWTANSSFENYKGLSQQSIGKYKENLSTEYTRYIEYLTFPELIAMNYTPEIINLEQFKDLKNIKILENFSEPVKVSHKALDKNYSCKKDNITNEIERIKFLNNECDTETNEIRKFFIFEQAYNNLKGSLK